MFVDNTGGSVGGAIRVAEGAIGLTDCTFDGNVGADGGAVFGGGLTIARTTFTFNDGGMGGAVTAVRGDNVADADTSFVDNSADQGGALALWLYEPGQVVTWSGGTFTSNHADWRGGAIWVSNGGGDDAAILLSDVVVEANDSFSVGGGLSLTGSNVSVSRSTVVGNTSASAGGIFVRTLTDLQLVEVDLTDNEALLDGGAMVLEDGSSATLDRCAVLRNTGASFGGGGGGVFLDVGSDLSSVSSDFGAGVDDNTPSDVHANESSYAYEADATFTCDGATSTCSVPPG
jgi:hypothetical protein